MVEVKVYEGLNPIAYVLLCFRHRYLQFSLNSIQTHQTGNPIHLCSTTRTHANQPTSDTCHWYITDLSICRLSGFTTPNAIQSAIRARAFVLLVSQLMKLAQITPKYQHWSSIVTDYQPLLYPLANRLLACAI